MNDFWNLLDRSVNDLKELGPFIRAIRLSECITQKQVSDATGFSIQTISKFENGRSNPRSVSSVRITEYVLEEAELEGQGVLNLYLSFVTCGTLFSSPIMDS